jgi:hypothetical protein
MHEDCLDSSTRKPAQLRRESPASAHWSKAFGLLSTGAARPIIEDMPLEIARLLLGLMIAAGHRRIADFVLERERSLVVALRQRGLPLPPAMSTATARNLYFGIGIFVALIELLRIYQIVH